MKLSIGQAWDETKAIVRTDGGAISAVALALSVLPGVVLETLSPSNARSSDGPWYIGVLGVVVAVLSLAGQLAIARIALGPSTTVGAAIGLGFRRVPALFGALFLAFLPFVLVLIVLAVVTGNGSLDSLPTQVPASFALPAVLIMLGGFYVLLRLLFLTPLAADRELNSVQLLKEGWRLSRGHALKLLGLVLIVLLVALILVGGLGGALAALVILLFGVAEPGNLSALFQGLIQQVLGAVISVLFALVVCRLYRQAAGVAASVPHAGGD